MIGIVDVSVCFLKAVLAESVLNVSPSVRPAPLTERNRTVSTRIGGGGRERAMGGTKFLHSQYRIAAEGRRGGLRTGRGSLKEVRIGPSR